MDNILFSASVVLPLLLIMASGAFARRIGLMDARFVEMGDNLVFRVFLPVSLCHNIMSASRDTATDIGAFLYVGLGIVFVFAVLFLVIPRIERDSSRIGVLIQCIGRSNYAYFGLPLVAMLFPGQDVSLAGMLVACVVPIYNVLSVIALTAYGAQKRTVRQTILGVAKNPLIIASLLGLAIRLSGWTPPDFLMKTASMLGGAAAPTALFFLGAGMNLAALRGGAREIAVGTAGRLIVCPLVMLAVGAALGFRGVALGCALIAFGSPTAVSGYPMARQLGGDGELAGALVVSTTAFSALSMFLMIFLLKTFSLI